jgi:hypothetical protein
MHRASLGAGLLLALVLVADRAPTVRAQQPATVPATPAPASMTAELGTAVETARRQFEARDLTALLAAVSEQYRSSGMTKAGVRESLVTMFSLHKQLRARVTLERVMLVSGTAWVYTSGEVTGQLPLLGWVTVLSWQDEPEVARREGSGWRLFGFQD